MRAKRFATCCKVGRRAYRMFKTAVRRVAALGYEIFIEPEVIEPLKINGAIDRNDYVGYLDR